MDELVNSKWFYWAATGLLAIMWGALVYFYKRQRDTDDARFREIESRQNEERERMNRLIAELPITYTLRDEFLRVSTQQNAKLDRIMDLLTNVRTDIAGYHGKRSEGE